MSIPVWAGPPACLLPLLVVVLDNFKKNNSLSFLFVSFSQAGLEPPIARACLLEFDTCSNDPSHHGWFLMKYVIIIILTTIKLNSFTNKTQPVLLNFHLTTSRWFRKFVNFNFVSPVVNMCIFFTACSVILPYLYDVMRAVWKKRGSVI